MPGNVASAAVSFGGGGAIAPTLTLIHHWECVIEIAENSISTPLSTWTFFQLIQLVEDVES
jgi:hypothetical protein